MKKSNFGGNRLEIELIALAIGIAAAGYFIGDGLKNFKNPQAKSLMDSLDEEDEHELMNENNVHYFMGISKEDAKTWLVSIKTSHILSLIIRCIIQR